MCANYKDDQSRAFRAGPLSGARSLALFPSRPSWTKSSSRLTSSSSTICSDCRLAAMFPRAFITAKEQCLRRGEGGVIRGAPGHQRGRQWVTRAPVSVVLVVFVRVNHGAGLHADLLEQVPHLLVDVLLRREKRHHLDLLNPPKQTTCRNQFLLK